MADKLLKSLDFGTGDKYYPSTKWEYVEGKPTIPTKTSELENDSNFLTEHQSLDEYSKQSDLTNHNTSNDSHNDIRLLIEGLTTRLNALANSDDTTLDQMAEVVAYIKNNKSLIEGITTSKVNVSDIIDNLTSSVTNKPLSAKQGVVLKGLIDAIVVPTKTSQLTNDSGFLTSHQSLANYYKKTETYSRSEVDTKVSSLTEEIGNLEKQINQSNIQDAQGETVEEALAWLEENGDTSLVYLLPNGNIARYTTIETVGGIEEVTERVTGEFVDNKRLSTSSGEFRDATGFVTTPLINISALPKDFKMKLTGIDWAYNDAGTSQMDGYAFATYRSDGSFHTANYTINKEHTSANIKINVISKTDVEFTLYDANASFSYTNVRFCGKGTSSNAIVELIYEKETPSSTESKWVDTGRGLISSDYDERLIALESDTASLKVRVKSLENSIMTSDTVPNYVLTEAEEVADKVLSVRNANSFVMALASDLHTNGSDTSSISVVHAGQGMNAINSMTQLDLVALLGDYEIYGFSYGDGDTDGEDARKSFKHAKKCFTEVSKGVPFMMLQGNHDELPTDTTEQAQQKYYAYIGANNVGTTVDYANKFRNYGYRDFENYKIRVIYLNTTDVSDNSVTGNCYVSTEQLNWLNTVALNFTDSEWMPIVLSHHPLNWDGMSSVLNALNTYKGNGKPIIHFHGHLHNFRAETLGTNAIPTITIPNACFDRNNEYGTSSSYGDSIKSMYGDVDANGNQRQFNKTKDTAEDTAFNVVVIDRENRKIHCFNYGAGIDRELSY